MKIKPLKFFCNCLCNGHPDPYNKPEPKPNIRKRFEFVKQDKKLDKFI